MLTSWLKAAATALRGKKKSDPWRPHHASTCKHRPTTITPAPQRGVPRPSANPTIIIIPPTPGPQLSKLTALRTPTEPEYPAASPLPQHPSPSINLIYPHNNQKTAPVTSVSSVSPTFTSNFHHANTTSNISPIKLPPDNINTLPISNLYYAYLLPPNVEHYAYCDIWTSAEDLPDSRKHLLKWVCNC